MYFGAGDVQGQREALCDGSIHLPDETDYASVATTAGNRRPQKPARRPSSVYGPLSGDRTLANVDNHGWNIGWNESVRIVQMLAASGIDQEEGRRIGQAWNTAVAASAAPSTWMSQADIDLIKTGEDSVKKAAAMAYWNFYGQFAANVDAATKAAWGISDIPDSKPAGHTDAYDIADGPRAPGFLSVRPNPSTAGGGIEVRWGKDAESVSDWDTAV